MAADRADEMPDQTEASLAIRLATLDDAAIVAAHRAAMFQDTGRLDAQRAAAMVAQVQPIARQLLASGEYVGWLAVAASGEVVAGAGVQVRRLLPRPETFVDREALVVNVYVQPTYRRRGLARRLMVTILEWCQEQGIERVSLHASRMGRPLYESLDFTLTNEYARYLTKSDTPRLKAGGL